MAAERAAKAAAVCVSGGSRIILMIMHVANSRMDFRSRRNLYLHGSNT
jgi:hypothetical protein